MAIFHLHVKHVSRGKGQTLASKASYNAGIRIRCTRTDRIYNRSSRKDVSYNEILLPIYANPVLLDRPTLVQAIENAEKRSNARLALDIEMSLPVELTAQANLDLVREFARRMFVDHGFAADVCVHEPLEKNPHCHMLIATREIMPNGEFARTKDRSRRTKCWMVELRQTWACAVNQALGQAGHPQRVSHLSNEDRQIEQFPMIHIGPCLASSKNHELSLQRKAHNAKIRVVNRMIKERQMLIERLQRTQLVSQSKQLSSNAQPSINSDGLNEHVEPLRIANRKSTIDHGLLSPDNGHKQLGSEMKHSDRSLPATRDLPRMDALDQNTDPSNDENELPNRPAM